MARACLAGGTLEVENATLGSIIGGGEAHPSAHHENAPANSRREVATFAHTA